MLDHVISSIELQAPLESRLVVVTPDWGVEINGRLSPKYLQPVALMVSAFSSHNDTLITGSEISDLMVEVYKKAVEQGADKIDMVDWHLSNDPEKPIKSRSIYNAAKKVGSSSTGQLSSNFFAFLGLDQSRVCEYAILCQDTKRMGSGLRAIHKAGLTDDVRDKLTTGYMAQHEQKHKEDLGLVHTMRHPYSRKEKPERKEKHIGLKKPLFVAVAENGQLLQVQPLSSHESSAGIFMAAVFPTYKVEQLFAEACSIINIQIVRSAYLSTPSSVNLRDMVDQLYTGYEGVIDKIDFERQVVAEFALFARIHKTKGQETLLGNKLRILIDRNEPDPLKATKISFY